MTRAEFCAALTALIAFARTGRVEDGAAGPADVYVEMVAHALAVAIEHRRHNDAPAAEHRRILIESFEKLYDLVDADQAASHHGKN